MLKWVQFYHEAVGYKEQKDALNCYNRSWSSMLSSKISMELTTLVGKMACHSYINLNSHFIN